MKMPKYIFLNLSLIFLVISCGDDIETKKEQRIITNPLNLSYRFRPEEDSPSRREAADPTVIKYKSDYYLFASKTGGYWRSGDLIEWELIRTDEIPTEEYAPTAIVLQDTVYFLASSREKSTIYKSAEPKTGHWEVARDSLPFPVWDPAFFQDDDGKVYMYWGCSDEKPIRGVEVDPEKNFEPIGEPVEFFHSKPENRGWENPGENNQLTSQAPWIEGAWMNKRNGKYYLQYSGPGTEFWTYADGVYVSDNPLGPFEYAKHNPFSRKPGGFIGGAGHGSTFQDDYGNYWHVATMAISNKHMFERRIGIFPTFFDEDGIMYTKTGYSDFPFKIPEKKINSFDEILTDWNLLSYDKPVEVSSQLKEHRKNKIVDENIRTYWSAETGDKGEWIKIDLEETYTIHSLQINYYQHNTDIYGRTSDNYHQYLLEYSKNGKDWNILVDKTENKTDIPHDLVNLKQPVQAQYIRMTNHRVPGGTFALSDLRIFGKGNGNKPQEITQFSVERQDTLRTTAKLKWEKCPDADGYMVRYGIAEDKLYLNHKVYSDTSITLRDLNTSSSYYFTIEAFNENGITKSNQIKRIE